MSDTQTSVKVAESADVFCSQCGKPAIATHPADGAGRCGGHLEVGDLLFDADCIEFLTAYQSLPDDSKRVMRGMLFAMYAATKHLEALRAEADALGGS
jgi:hypothetical protein